MFSRRAVYFIDILTAGDPTALLILRRHRLAVAHVVAAESGGKLPQACSLLAHATDIDDLLEGLDGVLEDGLDRLHDTESSLHIVDLGLHALDGLHLSGNLDEGLTVIESLEDSGGEGLLDVLDGSGLGDGGISITTGLGGKGGAEAGLERNEEVILVHLLVADGRSSGDKGGGGEFHYNYY